MQAAVKRPAMDEEDNTTTPSNDSLAVKRPAVEGAGAGASAETEENANGDAAGLTEAAAASAAAVASAAAAAVVANAAATTSAIPTTTATTSAIGVVPVVPVALRSLVSSKNAGSVIGRQGATIGAFREESGAKINISDTIVGAPDRIITATGPPAAVAKAYLLITAKLEEVRVQEGGPMAGGGAPVPGIRLLIPNSQVGSIIGKGGAVIKDLQEQSGARITVSEEPLPQSTERTVTISGPATSIHRVVYDICCKLLENPEKGQTIPFRPMPRGVPGPQEGMYNVGVPPPAGGPGGPYGMPRNYAQPTGYGAAYGGQVHPMAAQQQQQQQQQQMGMPPPQQQQQQHAQHAQPSMNIQQQIAAAQQAGLTSQQILVPADLVGAIIGKGGVKINEIRQSTGAQIKIDQAQWGATERLITVIGTPEANQAALYMIYQRLQAEQQRA